MKTSVTLKYFEIDCSQNSHMKKIRLREDKNKLHKMHQLKSKFMQCIFKHKNHYLASCINFHAVVSFRKLVPMRIFDIFGK